MRNFLLAVFLVALSAPARADAPRVVTDIPPVHSLVAQVMRGIGTPDVIVSDGASAHGYALRSSQARNLQDADIVFWIGEALTPWLERPLQTLAADALSVELLHAEGTTTHSYREHSDLGEHDHHDHDDEHSGLDPHAWLDPSNGKVWLEHIAEILASEDPENAGAYRANARGAMVELDRIIEELETGTENLEGQKLIVLHDAFQYLEARFDLPVVSAIALGDASKPGAARVSDVSDLASRIGVTCVLTEPGQDPSLAETVVQGLDVVWIEVDPLGSTLEPGRDLYARLFRSIAKALTDCRGSQ